MALAAGALGCTSTESPETEAGVLAPPAEGEGLQLKMVSTLEAGRETERCQMFVVEEPIAFDRSEVAFTEGSHHVLLFETDYTEIPTEDEDGNPVVADEWHECPEGAADIWSVERVIGGSQNPNGDNLLNGLPEGVAMKVAPGTVLLMNTHYINATAEPLETEAAINLYTVPYDEVETEAGVLFYYNPFIHVGPQSTGRARMRCRVDKDIEVLNLQSHMHKIGVDFHAHLVDHDGSMMDEIYQTTNWENVPIERFAPTLEVEAGQSLDYYCDYENNDMRDVYQGLTTEDEMCMLIGPYWPRDDNLEVCDDPEGGYVATWIGSGDRDCGESYACLLEVLNDDDADIEKAFPCVTNSCEAVAEPLSNVVNCFLADGGGACDEACGSDGEGCTSCLIEACAPQIEVCGASQCGG